MPLGLESGHHRDLVRREHLSDHSIYPDFGRDGARRGFAVAGDHHRFHTKPVQQADGFRGRGLRGVGHQVQRTHLTVPAGEDWRATEFGARGCRSTDCLRHRTHKLGAADFDRAAVDRGLHTESRFAPERSRCNRRDPLGREPGDNRARGGVLRGVFRRRHEHRQPSFVLAVRDFSRDQHHAAGGHRSSLVQHRNINATRCFEYLSTFDHDAELRTSTGSHHDRGRRGEPQRTRTGNDEYRHRGGKGVVCRAPGEQPPGQRCERDHDHHRDKDRRDAIRQALHRSLRPLRLADEPGDLSQRSIDPDTRGSDHKATGGVECGAEDGVTDSDLDRHRFTGQH